MSKNSVVHPTDDVYLWVEQESSIMLKAVTAYGDPVELDERDVLKIIAALQTALEQLQAFDDQ